MANWKSTINLSNANKDYANKNISIKDFGKIVSKLIRLNYYSKQNNEDAFELLDIASRFEDVDDVDDFDNCLNDLYDFADHLHRIWIKMY